ncbi:MAG: hypothetical protein M3Q56_04820 [Bacteroidota bacterium]|nr:hypothetical protein [Bacteroidota bacterium]
MKINQKIFVILFVMLALFEIAFSQNKQDKKGKGNNPETAMIDSCVMIIAADSSLMEKSTELKGVEKGNTSAYYDASGNILRLVKSTRPVAGDKTITYYFKDNNLVQSHHFEKNKLKKKGKIVYSHTIHYFMGSKLISSKQKSVTLKPKDEAIAESKLAKAKYKSFAANTNIYRDELAVIKKMKAAIK